MSCIHLLSYNKSIVSQIYANTEGTGFEIPLISLISNNMNVINVVTATQIQYLQKKLLIYQ